MQMMRNTRVLAMPRIYGSSLSRCYSRQAAARCNSHSVRRQIALVNRHPSMLSHTSVRSLSSKAEPSHGDVNDRMQELNGDKRRHAEFSELHKMMMTPVGDEGTTKGIERLGGNGPQHDGKEDKNDKEVIHNPTVYLYAKNISDALKMYTPETIAGFMLMDISSIGLTYGLISISGLDFSAEFVLAYTFSKIVRRIRFPLDISIAGSIAGVFPDLKKVRILKYTKKMMMGKMAEPPRSENDSKITKFANKMMDIMDQYGIAYVMGSRYAGVLLVTTFYTLMKMGIDINPWLEWIGVSESTGNTLGTWAAAVVFSAALCPFTIGIGAHIGKAIGRYRAMTKNRHNFF